MKYVFLLSIYLTFSTLLLSEPSSIYSDCAIEIEKDCQAIKKTRARIMQCLLEKGKNLSPKCKSSMDNLTDTTKEKSSQACKADVREHCTWIVPGGGRILKCLLKNEAKLSEPCSASMNEI